VWALDKAPNPKKAKPQKIKPIPGRTREAIDETLPAQVVDLLTAKQRLFVREYLVDLNATQAAIRAGYSAHTARQIGSENLLKPYIAAEIERALAERGGITRTRLVEELAKIAFSDIGKVVTWGPEAAVIRARENGVAITRMESRITLLDSDEIEDDVRGAVAEVSQSANGALHVKMHDKIAAIDKLARVLGMYRHKIGTSDGQQIVPVLVYTGAPEKILARKAGNASPPETGDRDGDESD
jgi:phage terminase small subunit